jgi:hypothetical protein
MYTRNADILVVAFPASEEPHVSRVAGLLTSALPPIRAPEIIKGVLTKCDLVPEETATRRRLKLAQLLRQSPQAQRRSFKIMTFCTSALNGEGIQECLESGLEAVAKKKYAEMENKRNSVVHIGQQEAGGWRGGFKCC